MIGWSLRLAPIDYKWRNIKKVASDTELLGQFRTKKNAYVYAKNVVYNSLTHKLIVIGFPYVNSQVDWEWDD